MNMEELFPLMEEIDIGIRNRQINAYKSLIFLLSQSKENVELNNYLMDWISTLIKDGVITEGEEEEDIRRHFCENNEPNRPGEEENFSSENNCFLNDNEDFYLEELIRLSNILGGNMMDLYIKEVSGEVLSA